MVTCRVVDRLWLQLKGIEVRKDETRRRFDLSHEEEKKMLATSSVGSPEELLREDSGHCFDLAHIIAARRHFDLAASLLGLFLSSTHLGLFLYIKFARNGRSFELLIAQVCIYAVSYPSGPSVRGDSPASDSRLSHGPLSCWFLMRSSLVPCPSLAVPRQLAVRCSRLPDHRAVPGQIRRPEQTSLLQTRLRQEAGLFSSPSECLSTVRASSRAAVPSPSSAAFAGFSSIESSTARWRRT